MAKWAKGLKAWALCERCGLRFKYADMVTEPGTGLFVDRLCNDGMWNRVDHPQNFAPKFRAEGLGLKNASPDRNEETARGTMITDESGIYILDDEGLPIF